MKEINYQKTLSKTIKDNYLSFLLGMIVIIIPVIIFGLTKITIPPLQDMLGKKNDYTFQTKKTSPVPYHLVKEGDDLWSISQKYYGSGYYAFQIAAYNNLKEPFILEPNQKILIPTIRPTTTENGDILPEAASTQRNNDAVLVYTVKTGDYLFQIAQAIYGDGNYMNKIIVANNIPYPYNIEVGQKLLIPR